MTPSRALWTTGVLVKTLLPGIAGIAHDATGLGDRSTWISACPFVLAVSIACTYLHKTHSAVTSNRQSVVVTESGHGSTGRFLIISQLSLDLAKQSRRTQAWIKAVPTSQLHYGIHRMRKCKLTLRNSDLLAINSQSDIRLSWPRRREKSSAYISVLRPMRRRPFMSDLQHSPATRHIAHAGHHPAIVPATYLKVPRSGSVGPSGPPPIVESSKPFYCLPLPIVPYRVRASECRFYLDGR